MKTTSLLLALGTLLGTAHAQTTPPKPKPRPAPVAPRVAATSSKSIGRKFIEKSKPTGSRTWPYTLIQ